MDIYSFLIVCFILFYSLTCIEKQNRMHVTAYKNYHNKNMEYLDNFDMLIVEYHEYNSRD